MPPNARHFPTARPVIGTMCGVTQTSGKTWYAAAYVALIPVTVGAAVLLVALNLDVGQSKWPDTQPEDQMVAKWRTAAVLAYTSGSAVGHVCALVAGLLAARWARDKPWRTGLVAAVLAGAGLGLADLAAASWKASHLLREFAASPLLTDNGTLIVDTGLQHHGRIPAAMAVVFATLLIIAEARSPQLVTQQRERPPPVIGKRSLTWVGCVRERSLKIASQTADDRLPHGRLGQCHAEGLQSRTTGLRPGLRRGGLSWLQGSPARRVGDRPRVA